MANLSTTYDDILRCARSLIVAGGYNGFSYADIAKVVGIRNASIHHHFPAKADLVHTLVTRYREEVAVGLAELTLHVPDPAGQIQAYMSYWQDCITTGSAPICVCALLSSQMQMLPTEVAAEVRAHFQTLSDWLTGVLSRGAEQGTVVLTDSAEAEAALLLATIHGAMLSARAHGDAGIFGVIARPALRRLFIQH
ncbi:TetR/AcrR family transcriptional regulator [Niveispirillum sp.]|uniref:TetR/AcrR family transcriptional regulator n=1 Tax=Niveispirillum sp. TaxID=1917217 RepID=UPI001B64D3D7|nr:TetR/AcrR family transcriptional regulator [Niveispirillum sp.]MBP7337182.1 TetR/AcrR family transcriptional regulator [Niveispirillum sp.]